MHWLHSLDQIVYRLGASCFTHTEFARVLYELREDRKHAMAIAFAESHRSAFRQTAAQVALDDTQETKANRLRAQATITEDGARVLITRPAFVAAQIELMAIEHILSLVEPDVKNIPYDFIAVQRTENTLALYWKAFVETRSYNGQINFDTRSEILGRGLTLPKFDGIESRDNFLHEFNKGDYKSLTLHELEWFYVGALQQIEKSPLVKSYMDALTDANNNPVFLGTIPEISQPLEPIATGKRLGVDIPHGRA
jgi:hypothetical protein